MAEGRTSWERPYGLAWLLQLAAELREWESEGSQDAGWWAAALLPLEDACVQRISEWLPKLAYPIRTGEHSQTAFAFGLVLDYAAVAGDAELTELVKATSLRLYGKDSRADLSFEPSGQDFLSPILAEADLMRRVMTPADFAHWLTRFVPDIPFALNTTGDSDWLPVATVTDLVFPVSAGTGYASSFEVVALL